MLVNSNGHWFTTNAYNFDLLSPDYRSLSSIDEDMKRREILKKHFVISAEKGDSCCFLYYNDRFISAWSKGNSLEARWVLQAAVNTYIAMGGK